MSTPVASSPQSALIRLLDQVEDALEGGALPHPEALAALDAAVLRSQGLPSSLARRAQALHLRALLVSRAVPEGIFDSLYDDVCARLEREGGGAVSVESRVRRAALSHTFLEAPRNLALWRGLALAACLLLVVGGFAAARGAIFTVGTRGGPARSGPDPRERLLEPVDAAWLLSGGLGAERRIQYPARGAGPGEVESPGSRLPGPGHSTRLFPVRGTGPTDDVSVVLDSLGSPAGEEDLFPERN